MILCISVSSSSFVVSFHFLYSNVHIHTRKASTEKFKQNKTENKIQRKKKTLDENEERELAYIMYLNSNAQADRNKLICV